MLLKKKFIILETVLCIALIKCLLLQYALAGDVTGYDFQLQNRFELEPKGGKPIKIKLIINAKLNTKPHPSRANTFIAAFDKVDIVVELLGLKQKVNLNTCKDFKKIAPSFKLPFLINKGKKTAIFQSVTVGKDDDITSKSMKRMVGIKFQLNEGPVRRTKKKTFTNVYPERTNYGKCRIHYKANKRPEKDNDWWIDINYFRSYCDDRKNTTNPDSEYLKGFCNADPENKLGFEENGRSIVHLTGKKLTYKELTRNFKGSYYPYKKAPRDKFFQYIDSRLALAESSKGATVPAFDEKNGETVQDNLYIPVTRRHIYDGEQDELRTIYKALACEPEYYSFFLSLVDYAIRCFEL